MIQILFNIVVTIAEILTNFFVLPIMSAIDQYMPNIGNTLNMVSNLFNHLSQYNTFILSYTGLEDTLIATLAIMIVAIVLIPINVHIFKMVAKWWQTIV